METTFLWDLDGTLTDPAVGITSAVRYSLQYFAVDIPPAEQLYSFIGPPLKASYREMFGFSDEQADEAVRRYREYYADVGLFENTPYPGIAAVLEAVGAAGGRHLLATSKPTVFARKILERFSLAPFFSGIYGSRLDGSLVEKADVIALALQKEQAGDLSRCVMIGDRRYDIDGAHANGIKAVGVLYGYGDRTELKGAGADWLAETVGDLKRLSLQLAVELRQKA